MNLKPGDVVQLNGSKVKMVVEWVDKNKVHCVWFDLQNSLERDSFSHECLFQDFPISGLRYDIQ